LNRFILSNWPFGPDEKALVYWICSPHTAPNGAKVMSVYFRQVTGAVTQMEVQWGLAQELWIGREFINGSPTLEEKHENLVTLQIDGINKQQVNNAGQICSLLYPLANAKEAFGEKCIQFFAEGKNWMIPCMEITRAFYMPHSVFTNQLLTDGGLEDLIVLNSWKQNGKTISFDFQPGVKSVSNGFAKSFAALYGSDALRNGWKSVYANYVRSKRIVAEIPSVSGLNLQYAIKAFGNNIFVTKIERIQFHCPFDHIEYGPEQMRKAEGNQTVNGTILSKTLPDTALIGEAGATARRGQSIEINGADTPWSFIREPSVSRKKNDGEKKHSAQKISIPANDDLYSLNDQAANGTLPSLVIAEAEQKGEKLTISAISKDRDFQIFLMAVNDLVCNFFWQFIASEEGKLDFSRKQNEIKFISITVEKNENYFTMIELRGKNGYSASTLILNSAVAKNMNATFIRELLQDNKHWSSKKLMETNCRYALLDHYTRRTEDRWAKLLHQKCVNCMNT